MHLYMIRSFEPFFRPSSLLELRQQYPDLCLSIFLLWE